MSQHCSIWFSWKWRSANNSPFLYLEKMKVALKNTCFHQGLWLFKNGIWIYNFCTNIADSNKIMGIWQLIRIFFSNAALVQNHCTKCHVSTTSLFRDKGFGQTWCLPQKYKPPKMPTPNRLNKMEQTRPKYQKSSSFSIFKNKLLSFIRPVAISIFKCTTLKGSNFLLGQG